MERYELKIWRFIKDEPRQFIRYLPDLTIPIKRRKDAESWIDETVKKATLKDNTNNRITLLKNE
jgi:hypothetical protein